MKPGETFGKRSLVALACLTVVWGGYLALRLEQPGYTDAYYYYNAAQRLADGEGLTDPYLWTYFNAPETLPGPSHTYWMPLESLVLAVPLAILGSGFGTAQLVMLACLVGMVWLTVALARHLDGRNRHVWSAALLVMFGGFYAPCWVTTDTFALYGLLGGAALMAGGKALRTRELSWFVLVGMLGGLAHLTRADGLLILIVFLAVALWPAANVPLRKVVGGLIAAGGGYVLVMAPWFVRNWRAIGSPLPLGGTDTIWMRSYDELVSYPAHIAPAHLLNWGLNDILQTRWLALTNNVGTFMAVETWVILGPLALIGLWRLRHHETVRIFAWYAVALHLVMTFVFALPGYRGGLFHSSAALLPFWAVLSMVGLDIAVERAARWRRWRVSEAQHVFAGAAVVLAAGLGIGLGLARTRTWNQNALFYREVARDLPSDAVLMVNDPPALYYHTGLYGVVVPNSDPGVVPKIARQYGVDYLVLDRNHTRPFTALFLREEQREYLTLVHIYGDDTPDVQDDIVVYRITPSGAASP